MERGQAVTQGTQFLSTPSARRATLQLHRSAAPRKLFLSTPSARRATFQGFFSLCLYFYFYPRPPRGGRLFRKVVFSRKNRFLSTPSARRATECVRANIEPLRISIHALREEGDGLRL